MDMFVDSNREEIKDKKLNKDLVNADLSNKLFIRFVSKANKFNNVDFSYSIFDSGYFRNCTFENCKFIGCKFINSNFTGASFSGCIFDYATFEKTFVDDDILKYSCPDRENLKLRFARTLRLNYSQLGDVAAANKAMKVELEATEVHYKKAWNSNDCYYRKKYQGLYRFYAFKDWVKFKILDFVWGNGENIGRFLRAILIILFMITLIDIYISRASVFVCDNAISISQSWDKLLASPQIFFGVYSPSYFSWGILTTILVVRLIMFALFMTIILKRLSRR